MSGLTAYSRLLSLNELFRFHYNYHDNLSSGNPSTVCTLTLITLSSRSRM